MEMEAVEMAGVGINLTIKVVRAFKLEQLPRHQYYFKICQLLKALILSLSACNHTLSLFSEYQLK